MPSARLLLVTTPLLVGCHFVFTYEAERSRDWGPLRDGSRVDGGARDGSRVEGGARDGAEVRDLLPGELAGSVEAGLREAGPDGVGAACGDGVCASNESCAICPEDCPCPDAAPPDSGVLDGPAPTGPCAGTWGAPTPQPPSHDWNAIWCSAPGEVFLAGDFGQLARYDGGTWTTWDSTDTGSTYGLQDLWGASPSLVYAVGAAETILRFDGASWAVERQKPPSALEGVWGASASCVGAVGGAGLALGNCQGGWSPLSSSFTETLYAIWGTSVSNVYMAGSGGKILRVDGVKVTLAYQAATSIAFKGIWGSSASDIYAVGSGGAIVHFDGSSWFAQVSGTPRALEAVWGSGPTQIFAVGAAGAVVCSDGAQWTPLASPTSYVLMDLAGCAPGGDLIVVGRGGTVLRYSP